MIVYRLHRDVRRASEYNFNAQSRWNPARTAMLYCASNVALCCLEVLVHTNADLIPDNYVWSFAELPSDPEAFNRIRNIRDVDYTRGLGKEWIDSRRSLAIRVPSVIVPDTGVDFNILLNPTHDDYSKVAWERGGSFTFDQRLFLDEASA